MTTNKTATAIHVIATIATRCRAGMLFSKKQAKRVELADLPEGALAAIEADPYLKVTYEADDMPIADMAEGRIIELEAKLQEAKDKLADAEQRIIGLADYQEQADHLLADCKAQIAELLAAVEAKDAEIAELKNGNKKTNSKKG